MEKYEENQSNANKLEQGLNAKVLHAYLCELFHFSFF